LIEKYGLGLPLLISQKLITLAGITGGANVSNAHIRHSGRDCANFRGTDDKSQAFQRILDI
jgi:hypothetical protein